MILTAAAIALHRSRGDITIEPFRPDCLGTVSYRFHAGMEIAVVEGTQSDFRAQGTLTRTTIPHDGLIVHPDNIYLLSTAEVLGSTAFAQQIFGLRSTGSMGLFLDVSANLGHVGCITRWTLELVAVKPVRIYSGQAIGQIIFWTVIGDWNPYEGEYRCMSLPLPSHQWKEP